VWRIEAPAEQSSIRIPHGLAGCDTYICGGIISPGWLVEELPPHRVLCDLNRSDLDASALVFGNRIVRFFFLFDEAVQTWHDLIGYHPFCSLVAVDCTFLKN
jgi:hypothetical protein